MALLTDLYPKKTPTSTTDLYNTLGTAIQDQADASIASKTAITEASQLSLDEQLKQQRQDYVKNSAAIQKDSYMRGRTVLSNLANRGLATSGLMQLGETQNTIAKGQQINTLADTFNTAQSGVNTQKTNLATALQNYTSEQKTAAATSQAQLGIQAKTAEDADVSRKTGLLESLIATIQSTTDPVQQKLLTDLYTAAAGGDSAKLNEITSQIQADPDSVATTNYTDAYKDVDLTKSVTDYGNIAVEGRDSASSGETEAVNKYLASSKLLDPNTEEGAVLAQAIVANKADNNVSVTNIDTKGGKGQLNDTFKVRFGSGDEVNVGGRELMALVMSGKVKLSNEEAFSLLTDKPGSNKTLAKGDVIGNKYDGFIVMYGNYLIKQGIASQNDKTSIGNIAKSLGLGGGVGSLGGTIPGLLAGVAKGAVGAVNDRQRLTLITGKE